MISGSGQSTPSLVKKHKTTPPTIITPEMAVLQIQGILQLCIIENKDYLNSSVLEVIIAKQDFDTNYSYILKQKFDTYFSNALEQKRVNKFFSFNELKEYVLNTIAPCFLETNHETSELVGKSHACEKLKKAAESWPTQRQYLAQVKYLEKQKRRKFKVIISESASPIQHYLKDEEDKGIDLTLKLSSLQLEKDIVDDNLHSKPSLLVIYDGNTKNKRFSHQPANYYPETDSNRQNKISKNKSI